MTLEQICSSDMVQKQQQNDTERTTTEKHKLDICSINIYILILQILQMKIQTTTE